MQQKNGHPRCYIWSLLWGQVVACNFFHPMNSIAETFSSVSCVSRTTMNSFIPPDCSGVFLFGAAWHLVAMSGLGRYQMYFIAEDTVAALHMSQPLGKALPHLMETVTLMGYSPSCNGGFLQMGWISCCAAVNISEQSLKLQKLRLCSYFLHGQTKGRNPKAQGHEKRSLLLFLLSFFFFFF